jgi:hypothetical protein
VIDVTPAWLFQIALLATAMLSALVLVSELVEPLPPPPQAVNIAKEDMPAIQADRVKSALIMMNGFAVGLLVDGIGFECECTTIGWR